MIFFGLSQFVAEIEKEIMPILFVLSKNKNPEAF
jgi:hypothetical protein